MNKRMRRTPTCQGSDSGNAGILNEQILFLVFKSIKWDVKALCLVASVNRKLQAIVTRLLWREVCVYRAPRMVATLMKSVPNGRIGGGWRSLAKLMFYCCGCESTRHFRVSGSSPGHFVKSTPTRFSKTSGRSFLARQCQGDVLYVSDPCEHPMGDKEDDLGIYRGVFEGFIKSKTRAYLIGRQLELEERVRCPYCGARVWSMTAARLVPKSAARRLGSHDGGLEYFVCVNGHLHGTCWLVPLSSDDDDVDDEDDNGEDDFAGDVGAHSIDYENLTVGRNSRSMISGNKLLGMGPQFDCMRGPHVASSSVGPGASRFSFGC